MEQISDFFSILFDSEKLITYGGLGLLLIIIFAETGLFFGFFFPGDALLFSAGLLCGTKDLDVNIVLMLFLITAVAILGNITGYISGRFFGKKILARENSLFFRKKHLEKTKQFYENHGGLSIIGGRFLPIVRTFVPIIAGIMNINFWKFNTYNIAGAFLWVWTLVPIGYFLGRKFPGLVDQLEYIIFGFIAITTFIVIRGAIRMKKRNKEDEAGKVEKD